MPDFAKTFALIDDDAALKDIVIGLFSALGTQFATTSAASCVWQDQEGRWETQRCQTRYINPGSAINRSVVSDRIRSSVRIAACVSFRQSEAWCFSSHMLDRPDADAASKSLHEILGQLLLSGQDAARAYISTFFRGTAPHYFREQFEAGTWLNLPSVAPFDAEDIIGQCRRIIYGSLILPAWKVQFQKSNNYVGRSRRLQYKMAHDRYTDTDCDQGNPLGIGNRNRISVRACDRWRTPQASVNDNSC
jgi:hypothetical protein